MDAKVMKKGDKKLIIVDMPNPKERWLKPNQLVIISVDITIKVFIY